MSLAKTNGFAWVKEMKSEKMESRKQIEPYRCRLQLNLGYLLLAKGVVGSTLLHEKVTDFVKM